MHGPQRKRSIAAPSAGSSCTEKSRWHSSVPSTPSSRVRGRARERRERLASACTRMACHMPHVARHDQVLLVVEVQLAERHVRSRACHAEIKVAWARIDRRAGGPRSEESACGRHLRRRPCRTRCGVAGVRYKVGPQCVTERSMHLLGNALKQPTPTLLCVLACQDSLTGWAGWYARRK